MKRDTGILLAGSLGVIVGLGLYGLKWFTSKKHTAYEEYYADHHRNYDNRYGDDHDGVEILALL